MNFSAKEERLFNVVNLKDEFDILVGCVQGSPSGPYLFTLLVDGIADHMSGTSIVAYADDIFFIYEANSWEGISEMASQSTKKQ